MTDSHATRAGFSLLELLIALSILAIAVLGVASAVYQTSAWNDVNTDRTLAHQASQQVMEMLAQEDLGTLQPDWNGTTFQVTPLLSAPSAPTGLITITDLAWDGTAGESYLITVEVQAGGVTYARLDSVRTAD